MKASTLRNGLFAAALVGGLGLASASQAQIAFTVTPGNIGEPQAAFTATYIQFGYAGIVDQVVTGAFDGVGDTFTETGYANFTSFQHPNEATSVLPVTSGLGVTYGMYALFEATGTVAPNGVGGISIVFTTFNMEIWVDTALNSVGAQTDNANNAGDQDGFSGQNAGSVFPNGAPNEAFTLVNTGDDVLVATTAGLIFGEANVAGGLANGDFDVLVLMNTDIGNDGNPANDFFSVPIAIGFILAADFNGNNQNLQGIGVGTFDDGRIPGNGNMFFTAIPEPSAISLLGLSLIGLGALARRRRRA